MVDTSKLGAVGLGIKVYLESQKTAQPHLYPIHRVMEKKGNPYVQDNAYVPKAPGQPKVPTPGPGIKSVSSLPRLGGPSPVPAPSAGNQMSFGEKKTATDILYPLAAAGVGGAGGWVVGKHLLEPLLASRGRQLQESVERMKILQRSAPTAAAALGALLLAALAVAHSKQKEKETRELQSLNLQAYDPTSGGFYRGEQVVPPRNFY